MSRKLKTETDTPAMQARALAAFAKSGPGDEGHEKAAAVFEHGQTWINCPACGAQWSVVDAVGGVSVDGFGFERVSEGDDYCAAK